MEIVHHDVIWNREKRHKSKLYYAFHKNSLLKKFRKYFYFFCTFKTENELNSIYIWWCISQDSEEEISSDDSGSSHVSERIVSAEDRKNKTSDTKKDQSKVLQQILPKKDGEKKIEDTERKIENVELIE